MHGNITARTGPTAEPVSLTEAKAQCKVDSSDEDALLLSWISEARAHVESITGQTMVTRNMRATMRQWDHCISLRSPLRKVTSITYLDCANTIQTLSPEIYDVDTSPLTGAVTLAYNATWPLIYDHPTAVTIDFVSGYATPFIVNTATDTLTATGHPIANGDIVRLSNSGGALPSGFAVNTDYYAIGVSGNTLQLALTAGGAAIDITGSGAGTHFVGGPDDSAFFTMRLAMRMLIGYWFDNRSAASGFKTHEIPMGVNALLAPHKVWSF